MKKGLLGAIAAMFGMSTTTKSIPFKASQLTEDFRPKMPKGCRASQPSEYFGRRSEIVTAYTKRGTKQMKLKNALKGNHEFDFITK